MKKYTVLKGEGTHSHVLEGNFTVKENEISNEYVVTSSGLLKHLTPTGDFGEHFTLSMSPGLYVQGEQLEYDPFTRKLVRTWD